MEKLAHAAETRSVLVVYTTKKLNFWSHPLLVLNMISTISECNKSLPPDDAGWGAASHMGLRKIVHQVVQEDQLLFQPLPANPRLAGKNSTLVSIISS